MFTYIKRTLRDRAVMLFLYCLIAVLLVWMYIALYPLIQQQAESIRGFLENFPKVFLKVFGVSDLNLITLESFLTFKHYGAIWPFMMIFLSAAIAGAGLAGEIERGTIEIPLACPLSRMKLFFGQYLTGLIALFIFTVSDILAVILFGELSGVQYDLAFHVKVGILGIFFGWASLSIAVLVSAVLSELRKTYTVLGGIFFVMYVINILGDMVGSLHALRYISLFYYFEPNYVLIHHLIRPESPVIMGLCTIICTGLGAFGFSRRDITV